MLFDKTAVDARLDPSQEKGQLAATLSRTLPLSSDVSVTLQDKYSVTQSLQSNPVPRRNPPAASVWQTDRSLRLNLRPTSTTLSAGVVTSNSDSQWHNKLSAEQQIVGPLNVTTSVTDPGTAASSKSIAAGFKHTWYRASARRRRLGIVAKLPNSRVAIAVSGERCSSQFMRMKGARRCLSSNLNG